MQFSHFMVETMEIWTKNVIITNSLHGRSLYSLHKLLEMECKRVETVYNCFNARNDLFAFNLKHTICNLNLS